MCAVGTQRWRELDTASNEACKNQLWPSTNVRVATTGYSGRASPACAGRPDGDS